jgi:hypothetical protein
MALHLANKTKVYIVSTVCLLGLVVILKNLLRIPAEVLSRDIVLFILVFSTFSVLYPESSTEATPSRLDRPLVWSLLIFLVTVAMVIVYAI